MVFYFREDDGNREDCTIVIPPQAIMKVELMTEFEKSCAPCSVLYITVSFFVQYSSTRHRVPLHTLEHCRVH